MELTKLNDLTNDLLVARLEVQALENELREEMAKNPRIAELEAKMAAASATRSSKQAEYLSVMVENNLKQWKTEQASVSRAARTTVKIDPAKEKEIKGKLTAGETVDGFLLNTTEYISIRFAK